MIQFYFHHTPNPMKVALLLEELGLAYELVAVDTLKGEQHEPAFRKVNPNGKLPALRDGEAVVFDSTAILLHLAERENRFLGAPSDRPALLSWLMFVASGLGPYSGQAVHFTRVHTESAYATNRYRREAERHYDVLEGRLKETPFLAGVEYTIADIGAWGWIDRAAIVHGDPAALARWPAIQAWFHGVEARPAVARARAVGKDVAWKREMDEAARRAMFPSNYPSAA